MYYAGIPYTRTGTQPVLPGDSVNILSDISLNNIQYGEFLMWNGESLVPGEAPNGGRGSTIPNLNFTKSNIKDVSQNMFFNSNSKYLLLDKRITIDKIRINQKNTRPLTIGYNVYINEYYDNSGTLQTIQSKTISNAIVSPVISGETYGSTIVDISATSFTNRNYVEVLIERSSNYVYNESTNTIARFNFYPYVNQYLNNVDISDNLNGIYNLGVKSINHIVEDGNTGCIIIGDTSDNYLRLPAENGSSIDIKAVSFWIKNWTGGYIIDGRNVLTHSQLTSNQFVEYGSPNDISAGIGFSKFINQDNVPYETVGIGGDPSDNSISLLHKDEWNFVYIEFDASGSFTSTNPLLFGTSIYGDGGSYTMKDLRVHSDSILNNDIENLFNHYDDNDVMVELLTTPVEREMTDLSDVSALNIMVGEFLKFDGTHYIPTNDVADISSTLTDLSGYTYNMTVNDLCDCVVTTNSYFIGSRTSKGAYTTVLGYEAMDQATDSGLQYNTAIGYRALYNTTSGQADRNTAIGAEALYSIAGGSTNTAIGNRAGYAHNSHSGIIIGYVASENATQGYSVAIGVGAARNKTQNYSVFIGNDSGGSSTSGTGSRNVAVGAGNATGLTSGYDNVIIGANSSRGLSTGYHNVFIGSNSTSGYPASNAIPGDISNAIGIGYESYPSASNTIQLGNTNHTNINTSATLTLGEITIPNTDGTQNTFLTTDGSGNLSFTNYEIKPHMTNVTFDGSNAIIVEFSRDISNVATYSPDDFSVVHDGSSISVLSVYESSSNLVLNFGSATAGSSSASGGTGNTESSSSSSSSQQDLSSQIFHEDFEDQAYTGDVTTATIVSGGYNSSNYALQGGGNSSYNRWRTNTTTYQSVSFWYYRDSANSGSNMEVLFDNNRQTNGINSLFFKNENGHTNKDKISFTSTQNAVSKIYVNGVDQSSAITTTWESSFTPITYADLTWHHFYIEFSSATNMPATFGQPDDGNNGYASSFTSWGAGGKFDEVRLFNTALSTSQISNLASGGTGNTESSSSSSSSSSTDSSAVDVPIDLDKLKFTYTKSVDGSNNIITTDGVKVKSFYYNGLGLTNLTNEEFTDLSDISLNSTTLASGHMIQYNGSHFTNIEPTITDISYNSAFLPDITNTRDIGSSSLKIKDIHVAGTVDVGTTITTTQLSVGTATYPNTYGNINQFLRANNTGTLYWSHVYLNDLYDVNTASLANENFLSYSSSSSSWLVSNLPNDNSANIVTLNNKVTDISNYTIALSAEITDLSNDTTQIVTDLSSLVFTTLSTEIYDLSQETLSDIQDLSQTLHTKINVDLAAVIGGAGPALDTLKELEDYVTGLSGNIVGDLITDVLDISNSIPHMFNDLNDVSTASITTDKLIKWNGTYFTESQLLYDNTSTGYIGIGTNNPSYPLTVDSYTTSNISNIGYLDQSGVALKQNQTNSEISIYASKGIWTGTSFYASSDIRIKKFIVDLIPSACMTFVRQLKAKKYNFVDNIKHGSKEVYGFIAQDVKKICPNVVTTQQEFIPDIFKAVENITWTKVDKKWKLTILDNSIEIKANTMVRFYVSDRKNSEIMKDIVNCRYNSKSFLFDKIYEDIFIYGHRVDDFLALDKEQLFTLHHGSIQSLDTNQQHINNEIKQLKEENESLRSIIYSLQGQLEKVISHLGIK